MSSAPTLPAAATISDLTPPRAYSYAPHTLIECSLSLSDFSPHPPIADGLPFMYTVHMHELRFEWDDAKNRSNIKKHGISFEEAQTVFLDDYAIRFYDPDHSEDDDRFIMLGLSFKLRILVVCHCFKDSDRTIRIISARKATRAEAKHYER